MNPPMEVPTMRSKHSRIGRPHETSRYRSTSNVKNPLEPPPSSTRTRMAYTISHLEKTKECPPQPNGSSAFFQPRSRACARRGVSIATLRFVTLRAKSPSATSVRLLATPSLVRARDLPQTPKWILVRKASISTTMKCTHCKKKVTLMSFTCACAGVFCLTCRLPEVHSCPSPTKETVTLPKVVAPKVEKI